MYGFSITLNDSFENAQQRVVEALKAEGFGILTEIDVKATLKAKLDIERRPYKILGACNPKLANQAIESEPDVGLLLPCNVLLREDENGQVVVAFMDPQSVLGLSDNADLKSLGNEVKGKLERVRDALQG